jgi:hypothetical protein
VQRRGDLRFQPTSNLKLGSWAELTSDEIASSGTQAGSDIIPADRCGLGECGDRHRRSLGSPQGVERRVKTERCQERQVAQAARNVWRVVEIATIFHPTDRPHLAAFILPSTVAFS